MLLANFNRKEHLRHRAVSLRQHGFLVIITGLDIGMRGLNEVVKFLFLSLFLPSSR